MPQMSKCTLCNEKGGIYELEQILTQREVFDKMKSWKKNPGVWEFSYLL